MSDIFLMNPAAGAFTCVWLASRDRAAHFAIEISFVIDDTDPAAVSVADIKTIACMQLIDHFKLCAWAAAHGQEIVTIRVQVVNIASRTAFLSDQLLL